jgi:hypothetical protein
VRVGETDREGEEHGAVECVVGVWDEEGGMRGVGRRRNRRQKEEKTAHVDLTRTEVALTHALTLSNC